MGLLAATVRSRAPNLLGGPLRGVEVVEGRIDEGRPRSILLQPLPTGHELSAALGMCPTGCSSLPGRQRPERSSRQCAPRADDARTETADEVQAGRHEARAQVKS